MKNKIYAMLLLMLCMQSCIFSNDDFLKTELENGLKIISTEQQKNLIFEHPDAKTHSVLISENIDSLAWDEKLVYGYANKKYFIVDKKDHNVKWFSDYFEFRKNINSVNVPILKSIEAW